LLGEQWLCLLEAQILISKLHPLPKGGISLPVKRHAPEITQKFLLLLQSSMAFGSLNQWFSTFSGPSPGKIIF
jgi:hypothetical protein